VLLLVTCPVPAHSAGEALRVKEKASRKCILNTIRGGIFAVKQALKLELSEARLMAAAAIAKAAALGVAETVCIADEGGFPLLIERMDGARITGPQIAWNKAFTAAGHRRSTHLFNQAPNGPALPGNEAFGIQWSFDGKFAVFVGGYPIVVDGAVVGGVGVSGGNGEQDTACGVAALLALRDALVGHTVVVDADIKA
jgi:uncharacterized protein GlcG (DUF336 family)